MASLQHYKALGWALAFLGCAGLSPLMAADAAIDDDPGEEDAEEQVTTTAPAVSAGEVKFWEAMKLFRSKAPADLAAGRAALEAAVAQEFTHAQLFLAECYQSGGYGYPKNAKKAAALVRLAAERGNAFAQVSYGMVLFSGIGVRRDEEKAFQWLNAAVADGADYTRPMPPTDFHVGAGELPPELGVAGAAAADPVASAKARAHFFLGLLLEKRKDGAGAQAHFVAAATAGVSGRDGVMQAATQAAVNYALGRGVPRDPAKANEMLEQSRKLSRHAGISLLHNYATAKLVDDFAVSELEEAVAKASDEAEGEMQMNIARLFTDKKSKDYNPKEAVTWFELAAESGKPWAMLELGFLYTRGDLGKPEPEKAFAWFQRAMGDDEEVKHYLAWANVVICYHHGIGMAKDEGRARELASKRKDEEIVSYLTTIGQCPGSVLTFEQWVALNELWAKKDAHAQYLMGLRSEGGWGVRQHDKDAAAWYRKAMKRNHPAAARQLGLLYITKGQHLGMDFAERWQGALECYQVASSAGDAKATALLATMNSVGLGMGGTRVDAKAQRMLERSLELDPELTFAMNKLGELHEARYRVAESLGDTNAARSHIEEARRRYEQAHAKDDVDATYNLGRLHREGAFGKADYSNAYEYLEVAAQRGHVGARFHLGEMHDRGEGVPDTPVEAAYYYRLAALDGHEEAAKRLVSFYLEGKGGAQDLERAQFWLLRLVELGNVPALARYADLAQQQGKTEEAVKLYNRLLKGDNRIGQALAYDRLSRCYRAGVGVKRDVKRADKYRAKALELGCPDTVLSAAMEKMASGNAADAVLDMSRIADTHAAAAYQLGELFYRGRLVQKSPETGLAYLRKAGAMGHAEAMFMLADLAASGVNGAPGLDEAIKLAQKAEAVGHPKAAELRERLEARKQAGGCRRAAAREGGEKLTLSATGRGRSSRWRREGGGALVGA